MDDGVGLSYPSYSGCMRSYSMCNTFRRRYIIT